MEKRLIGLEKQLTTILGKRSYTRLKEAGKGEYRGAYFFSLEFDDGTKIYVCCGKKYYEKSLLELISRHSFFRQNIEILGAKCKAIVERDNRQAKTLGLEPVIYRGLRPIINKTCTHQFWGALDLEQGGKRFSHIETSLWYALQGVPLGNEDYFSKKINRIDEDLGQYDQLDKKKFRAILLGYLYEKLPEWLIH